MTQYKNLHLYLIVPLVIVLLGFTPSYWLRFTDAPWRHHLHGLTATLWFLMLIVQPYLITRGHRDRHRVFGMFALIVAGGVAVSGLSVIQWNFASETMPEVAKYGLSLMDVLLVTGFLVALGMAIVHSGQLEDHARWMISTVFWGVSPGLVRVLFFPIILAGVENPGQWFPVALAAAGGLNMLMLGSIMFLERRAHPAYVFAAIGSLPQWLTLYFGSLDWWRVAADAIFKM